MTTSDVTYRDDLIVTVRGLTLLEITDSVRKFRSQIAPIVASATDSALSGKKQPVGSSETVQTFLKKGSEILDHLVGIAVVRPDVPFLLQMLPYSVKIAALGAIIRHTLDEHPADKLTMAVAMAAISCLAESPNAQWVTPASQPLALN